MSRQIHLLISKYSNNLEKDLKSENEQTLGDFYASEMGESIKHQMDKVKSSQDLYHNENVSTDYLISNNLNMSKVSGDPRNQIIGNETRDELLEKLNYIINLFEDEKEIKKTKRTKKLYCTVFRNFCDICLGFFRVYWEIQALTPIYMNYDCGDETYYIFWKTIIPRP